MRRFFLKHRLIVGIFVASLLLICAVLFFFIQQSENQRRFATTPSQSAKDILYDLQSQLQVTVDIPIWGYNEQWIGENKQQFYIWGNEFSMGELDRLEEDTYPSLPNKKDASLFLEKFNETSKKFFEDRGFVQNEPNTIDPFGHGDTQEYAFEKGEMKCFYQLSADRKHWGTFYCGKLDQKILDQQKPFATIIASFRKKDDPFQFRIDHIATDSASGWFEEEFVRYRDSTDFYWIAKKEEGQWHIIWKYMGYPPDPIGLPNPLCAYMEKQGIPQSVYTTCQKLENGKYIVYPSPTPEPTHEYTPNERSMFGG